MLSENTHFEMNEAELKRRYPNASRSFIKANLLDPENHSAAPSPNPQRAAQADVARPAQREKENAGRYAVVITSFRVRLADDDALIGKYFVDALRYSGLLASDEVGGLDYKVRQEKVAHKSDEKTVVEITPI